MPFTFLYKILISAHAEKNLKTQDWHQFNIKGIAMSYKEFALSLRAFLPKLEGIPL